MRISRETLLRHAADTGFRPEVLEKDTGRYYLRALNV